MKQSVKVIIWAAVIVLVLAGAYVGYILLKDQYDQTPTSSAPTASSELETAPAADFTVYDADGNKVALSSKFGKPIVLNFWATWCGPCRDELSDFNKVFADLGDQVEFLMVNVDGPGTETEVKTFLAENGYTFPVFYDTDYSGTKAYGVSGIPVSFFINTDGEVVVTATHRGTIEEDDLRKNIGLILD